MKKRKKEAKKTTKNWEITKNLQIHGRGNYFEVGGQTSPGVQDTPTQS